MRKRMWFGLPVLVLAAAAVLLVRTEHSASAQGLTLDRSLAALLPPNATSLVGVDVEALKGTPAYRRFEEQSRQKRDSHFDEFTAQTGFDPRRDVESLLVASWGPAGAKDPEFVAVARGRFNVDAISRVLREKKATVETYRGLPVFGPEQKEQQQQHNQGRFVFLDSQTALAGTRVAVLGAIDRKLGGGPSLLSNTALLGRAQTIGGAHQVWVVSDSPGQMVSRALPKNADAQASNFARIFSSMRNTAIALDLTGGLDLRASGVCGTAQDAKTLADAARGMVALGRLSASSEDPSLLTVFDGVEVQERDAELNIAVKIDQQSLDKLLDQTGSRRRERVKLD